MQKTGPRHVRVGPCLQRSVQIVWCTCVTSRAHVTMGFCPREVHAERGNEIARQTRADKLRQMQDSLWPGPKFSAGPLEGWSEDERSTGHEHPPATRSMHRETFHACTGDPRGPIYAMQRRCLLTCPSRPAPVPPRTPPSGAARDSAPLLARSSATVPRTAGSPREDPEELHQSPLPFRPIPRPLYHSLRAWQSQGLHLHRRCGALHARPAKLQTKQRSAD